MGGAPIRELNSALQTFKQALSEDTLAMKRVEIAVVTFGPVRVETNFQTVDMWQPPHLTASGDTPMGAAITEGLEMLRQRKTQYKDNAIETFRPWVFLMTDGAPTDRWEHATDLVRQGEGEASKGFSFWGIGVENANMDILKKICTEDRPPLKLAGLQFKEMFVWLSASLKSVSGSQPGAKVIIEPPKGWTEV